MPERRPSGAQADDIEDVKKVCFIFFSMYGVMAYLLLSSARWVSPANW